MGRVGRGNTLILSWEISQDCVQLRVIGILTEILRPAVAQDDNDGVLICDLPKFFLQLHNSVIPNLRKEMRSLGRHHPQPSSLRKCFAIRQLEGAHSHPHSVILRSIRILNATKDLNSSQNLIIGRDPYGRFLSLRSGKALL